MASNSFIPCITVDRKKVQNSKKNVKYYIIMPLEENKRKKKKTRNSVFSYLGGKQGAT